MKQESMLDHCLEIFSVVRNFIINQAGYENRGGAEIANKKTDVAVKFDLETERKVVDYCRENKLPVFIKSEEKGDIEVSKKPEYLLIVDPIDGSTNLKKRIEGSAFSIAGLKYKKDKNFNANDVQFALIGSLMTGSVVMGIKGKGVYYKGIFSKYEKIMVSGSKNIDLSKACVEIDLDFGLNEAGGIDQNGAKGINKVLPLLYPERKFKHLRRIGSASLELMNVCMGDLGEISGVDAYIDARNISTPENWIGAKMLIEEGGGKFTDLDGKDITNVNNMTTPFSYIAAGNHILHKKILDSLKLR